MTILNYPIPVLKTAPTKPYRCPECGRFLRLVLSTDNGYALVLGFCSNEGLIVVLGERKNT